MRDGRQPLHLAARGLHPLGIDVAETAVSIAREHAAERAFDAAFLAADALRIDRSGWSIASIGSERLLAQVRS
jgi:2-polyprenyl-3-methyl-5-hydroxy-6-metoxy-1,4-benzoquinol methylase